MKTKLGTFLFVLTMVFIANAQTTKPKQTVNKPTTQTSQNKPVEPEVNIEYDKTNDIYSIIDKKTGLKIKEIQYKDYTICGTNEYIRIYKGCNKILVMVEPSINKLRSEFAYYGIEVSVE